jgi:diguanylate cyclase (GGDEF)-like protein
MIQKILVFVLLLALMASCAPQLTPSLIQLIEQSPTSAQTIPTSTLVVSTATQKTPHGTKAPSGQQGQGQGSDASQPMNFDIPAALSEKGICENLEREFQRKDGSQLIGIFSAKMTTLQGIQHIICIIHDITERKYLETELQRQANTDGLTGVFNRRYFLDVAHAEIARAARFHHPLSLALLDLDHFKNINDVYGHTVGDLALIALAEICLENIREMDLFARFGGDEFILLLPETNFDQAYEVVKRICLILSEEAIDLDGKLIALTISAGIASLANGQESFDALLSRADQALYQAKEGGRNRVSVTNDLLKA